MKHFYCFHRFLSLKCVCWVCMTHTVDQADRASLKDCRWHWMILYVHGSPPILLGMADKGEKSIDASEKSKQQAKIDFRRLSWNCPKQQWIWRKTADPLGVQWNFNEAAGSFIWSWLSRTVGNCHTIWRTFCKRMMTIMKMMTTVTRWLSQVFVVFTPT